MTTPETPDFTSVIHWHKGPAQGGGGTAGIDDQGISRWWDGDRLMIIVETTDGHEIAVVDIDCDEDYFNVTEVSNGETYDAWDPQSWLWWAKLDENFIPSISA